MSAVNTNPIRRIAVVTGSRAEYGLLRSVIKAIAAHPNLEMRLVVSGAHLLPPQNTVSEVQAEFPVDCSITMQLPNGRGRQHEAESLGRGVSGFAEYLGRTKPDVVLLLGDRIEPFAAAAAASVAGIRIAHLHGGDRAEGIADESMRHAISKLAHLHFPATQTSAMRLIAMGENPQRVHVVGSPAIDELNEIPAMSEDRFQSHGSPRIVVLLHPVGDDDKIEHARCAKLISIAQAIAPVIAMHPNHDAGRSGIVRAIEESGCPSVTHLRREDFIGLLRRASVLIGNSSAGLIEAAAIPIYAINIGTRQAGRESAANVIHVPEWDYQTIERSLRQSLSVPSLAKGDIIHPYGSGQTGRRTAELLAAFAPQAHAIRKRNSY